MYVLQAAPIVQPRFMAPYLGQAPAPAQSSQQLRREGAIIEVEVAVPRALAGARTQAGKAAGTPQVIRALIDTGASISAVQEAVAVAAGLTPSGSIQLGGIGGSSQRPLYATRVVLPAYGVEIQPIEVAGVSLDFGPFQMLIGRDVLEQIHFLYRGPDGNFSLEKEGAPGDLAIEPGAEDKLSTESIVAIGAGGAGLIFAGLFLSGIL